MLIFINFLNYTCICHFVSKLGLKTVISPLGVDIFFGKEVGSSFFTILILSGLILLP